MKLVKNSTKILPIRYRDWKATKCISERVATKDDVQNGFAAFYLEDAKDHKAVEVDLPTLAYLRDQSVENDDHWEVVVIIQFESYFIDDFGYCELVGYRKFNGEADYCEPNDIKWFRGYEIEKFV